MRPRGRSHCIDGARSRLREVPSSTCSGPRRGEGVHPTDERRTHTVFERFTDRARRVVVLAQEEARLLNHNYIGTEHILLGLIHEGEGVAAKALESLGISLEAVRGTGRGDHRSRRRRRLRVTFRSRRARRRCSSCRCARRCSSATTTSAPSTSSSGSIREGEGVAAQVLVKLGADLSRVRQQVIQLLSGYAGSPRKVRRRAAARRPGAAFGLARPRPVRSQPHPARARQEARPGDRAREGDRAGDAGAVAPHEEQPGAHR